MATYLTNNPFDMAHGVDSNPYPGSRSTGQVRRMPAVDYALMGHNMQVMQGDVDFIREPGTNYGIVTQSYRRTLPGKRFALKGVDDGVIQEHEICFRVINSRLDEKRLELDPNNPLNQQLVSNKVTSSYNGMTCAEAVKKVVFAGIAAYQATGRGNRDQGLCLKISSVITVANPGNCKIHAGARVAFRPTPTIVSDHGDLVPSIILGGEPDTKVVATLMEVHPYYELAHRMFAGRHGLLKHRYVGIDNECSDHSHRMNDKALVASYMADTDIASVVPADGSFPLKLRDSLSTVMGNECIALVESKGFENLIMMQQHFQHCVQWAESNLVVSDNLQVSYKLASDPKARSVHKEWVKRLIKLGFANYFFLRDVSLRTSGGENINNYSDFVQDLNTIKMNFPNIDDPESMVPDSGRVKFMSTDQVGNPNYKLTIFERFHHLTTFGLECQQDASDYTSGKTIGQAVSDGNPYQQVDVRFV